MNRTFLAHQPPAHARMTDPGYAAKYYRVSSPIGDDDLCAHLAGEITLACPLANDGMAWVAACDIDTGGLPAIRSVLHAAEVRGCHAYGFALTSDTHDGGHIWIVFDQPHPSQDLHALMRDILSDAGVPGAEVYPSAADLRLPFGVHRRCNRRGDLLLTSTAAPRSIDADPLAALDHFAAHIQHTSSAPVEQSRQLQEQRRHQLDEQIAEARTAQPRLRIGGQPTGIEIIQAYNAMTDLVRLLEQYGGTLAYCYAGGKVLMHCAATQDHRNGDASPSLIVQPGTGRQVGKLICGCYSPQCRLHNNPSQVKDPFEVYCIMEGIDHRDGVKRLSRTFSPTTARTPQRGNTSGRRSFSNLAASITPPDQPQPEAATSMPHPATARAAAPHHGQSTTLRPAAPAHPPAIWRTAAHARLEELRRSPSARPMDKQLYAYLLERCQQQPACRPSNAAAAAALGVCEGTIKLTKRRLSQLGYIAVTTSQDGKSTSIIHLILPVALPTPHEETARGVIGGVIPRSPESKLGIESTKKGGGRGEPITPLAPNPEPTPTITPAATTKPATETPPATRAALRQQRNQARDTDALIREHALLRAKSRETTNQRQRYALRHLATEIADVLAQRGVMVAESRDARAEHAPAAPAVPAQEQDAAVPQHEQPDATMSTSAELPLVASVPALRHTLALPTAAHPALTTEQITALVRAGLRVRLPSMRRMLIDQIGVQLHGGVMQITCPPGCSEQQVSQILLPHLAAVLDDQGISGVQRISIARSAAGLTVALLPAWLPSEVGMVLPVGMRDALIGATWVQDVLYGATPIQTVLLHADTTGAVALVMAAYAEQHPSSAAPASAEAVALLPCSAVGCETQPMIAESRNIRVCDRTAVMPEQAHDLVARLLLRETSAGHPALDELLCEGSPDAMQPLGRNGQLRTRGANGVLQTTGQLRAVHPQPILASGDAVERQAQRLTASSIVIGQHDQALASALGIGPTHEDRFQIAVQVGLAQPSDLVMPQASGAHDQQHLPELQPIVPVATELVDQLVGLGRTVATARGRTPNAGIQRVRGQGLGRCHIPAQRVQGMAQLTHAAERILDIRPAQLLGLHRVDHQLYVGGTQLAQQLGALFRSQAPQCSNAALAMTAQALIAEDGPNRRTVQFGLVAALTDPGDFFKGVRDLLDETRSLLAHRWFLWSFNTHHCRCTVLPGQHQCRERGAFAGGGYSEAGGQRHAIACLCPPRHVPYNTPQRRGFIASEPVSVEVATSVSADVSTSSAQTRAPPEGNPAARSV